jgi:dihydropteroate synthase
MGILNVTPDSFSDGGVHDTQEQAYKHASKMLEEGADIIDVGGESTRPGSQAPSTAEELARVLPVVERLAREGTVVSVDTRNATVAARCVEAGAAIINDVSGFRDPAMVEVAAGCDAGLIIMHMQGEPGTMQQEPCYKDVVVEVSIYLQQQASMLESHGVAHDRIAIDPGPGFGKTFEHNKALLRATPRLSNICRPTHNQPYPLVAAWSRKGFIGTLTGEPTPAKRVAGSVAIACYAAARGARILRVHDVAPTVQALKAIEGLR